MILMPTVRNKLTPDPNPNQPKTQTVVLNYTAAGPKQVEFHKAWRDFPTRIICGSVGSSKTFSVCADLIFNLWFNKRFQGKTALVVGLTSAHCRDLLLPLFKQILTNETPQGNIGAIPNVNYKITYAPTLKIELFGYGFVSKLIFLSLESKDNLRAWNASLVYCDDLGSTDEESWNHVCDRAYREADGIGGMIATANPTNPSSWVYKRYFGPLADTGLAPDGVYLDTWNLYDNPTLKERWPIMEQRYAYSPVEFKRKILGEWVGQDGLVFSNFDRARHVMWRSNKSITRTDLDFIRESAVYCGLDFGSRDPTVCLWVARWQDKYYVFREYYNNAAGATIRKHADLIKSKTEPVVRYYSDSYTETVQTYSTYGLNLTVADKGAGSLLNGIALINQLLAEGRLFIVDECPNLIREMESYEWKPGAAKDEPRDKDNHCCDALRYVIYSLMGGANQTGMFFAASTTLPLIAPVVGDFTLVPTDAKRPAATARVIGMRVDGTLVYADAADSG